MEKHDINPNPPNNMNQYNYHSSLKQAFCPAAVALAMAVLLACPGRSSAQTTTLVLGNPNWNITLTDYGYSDFLLDNTPGFEGREYLSGEWGAAVGYTSGGTVVGPKWLDPQWSYPDWVTNSTFQVVSPIALTGALNADGLPIAQSVIASNDLQITLRYEMLDTVTGTPMGGAPASTAGLGGSLMSGRYVLKQTYTIKNISGGTLSNVQFFQFLHGLQSQRGLYDNRAYAGSLSEFRYDVTQVGVDPWAVGPVVAGSTSAGLEDFIGFHSKVAPSGYEIGYYGIEGNGIDNHGAGKPSEGVHLSVENNWLSEPYLSRKDTDVFTPPQRWIAGTERWNLGSLAANASVTHEVLLSVRTGTKVLTGTSSSGGCNGGSSEPGGLDYQFDTVSTEGSCFAGFSRANDAELATRIAAGEFDGFTFLTPGSPAQVWDVTFSGAYSGPVVLSLAYDATLLPAGFDESTLAIHHFSGGAWQALPSTVDSLTHKIVVSTTTLGPFALGIDGAAATFQIDASVLPGNSGTVTGAGAYPQTASVTLVAAPNPGYVFVNWTEGVTTVSTSPSYTFAVQADRTLVANFLPVGSAKAISTSSSPTSAGSTSGDGAYAQNTSATVVASANSGYKFSKWMVNGVKVNGAGSSYTFNVTGDRALVAVFKPVYIVTATSEPAGDFEVQADSASYEPGGKVTMEVNHIAPGYSFVNWTENGVVVSNMKAFTFNVNGNRNLVAHFALGNRIDLSADPKTAGIVTGGGVYTAGTVPLVAEAKLGYIFTNWSMNGTVVSTSPSYDHSFPATVDQALVANFVAWLPTLSNVQLMPGTLMLAWPVGASGWVLQESPDLSMGSWLDSTLVPAVVGSENQVTVTPSPGSFFFRLAHP